MPKADFISTARIELIVIIILAVVVFIISSQIDILETIFFFSQKHENLELDEILPTLSFLTFALMIFSMRRWREIHKARETLEKKNSDLKAANQEIKQLQEILPICSWCKKIRDDKGYWSQVERYFSKHSDIKFTHSICPDCMKKMYPDFDHADIEEDRLNN